MKIYFDSMRKCPLFAGINDSQISHMLDCLNAEIRTFEKKEYILREGDPVQYLGIMLIGSAHIERTDYFGNRSIVANISESGLFGESFACAGVEQMPVSVVANDDCDIMFVDCMRILKSCGNACAFHQQLIYNLMRIVSSKNLLFYQKIEITSKRTTRDKLMTYLLIQAKNSDSNSFQIPFDRQQLADYLEVERSGLSAEISKLRMEGVLLSEKNSFTLLKDPQEV